MKRLKSLVVAALLVPAFALAQPKTADEWYKEGETQYNLGDFDKAAEAFKQGFASETDDSKKPAYLYNVAQAYRQGNKCKDSAFFYKRYLSLKDQDTVKPLKPEKRAEIESRIAELEECAKTQPGGGTTTTPTPVKTTPTPVKTMPTKTTPVKTTPTKTTPPRITATKADPTPAKTVSQPTEEEEEEEEETTVTESFGTQPSLVSARVLLGGAYVGMGDLDVGMRGAFALFGGYPVLRQEKLLVEAGVAFAASPIDYTNNMTTAASRASLVSALVNGAATYTVMPKIKARGDLGLGILSFSGLEMGNPFTEGGLGTTGALTMFNLRLGVSADYEITPNLVATATPFSLSYSPAKEGLRSDIGSITQISFMVGVGYRM